MRVLKYTTILALGLALPGLAVAQETPTAPLEIRQVSTPYNRVRTDGAPNGGTVLSPGGGITAPTSAQFQSFVPFGGGTPTHVVGGITTPRPQDPSGAVKQVTARIGGAVILQGVSYLFGGELPPPETDETGTELPGNVLAREFWYKEPYSADDHATARYYYSPNAELVYGVEPGITEVTWRKATPFASLPAGFPSINDGEISVNPDTEVAYTMLREGAVYYALFKKRYLVVGSPVKTPRKIYWTEGVFRQSGWPVAVPSARIAEVNILYHGDDDGGVPKRIEDVTKIYRAPGDVPVVEDMGNNVLSETRTIWHDRVQNSILAYNREGRVFMELLGDAQPNGARQQLGIEIVDIIAQPTPADVRIELGERLRSTEKGEDDAILHPEVVLQSVAQEFAYRHRDPDSGRTVYYAERETLNKNDLLIHWLESGEQGILWPHRLARYELDWPTDVAKYSHYVRPLVTTELEAKATAAPLPAENSPVLVYQDPLDRPRAKLSETFAYYTFLDAAHPAHRGLLRFVSGDYLRYERVFSWLDENLKADNLKTSVATELKAVSDYYNYPAAVAAHQAHLDYLAYLAARQRGVNGDWKLYLSDDYITEDAGSISSWAVEVVTPSGTQTFPGDSGLTLTLNQTDAAPYPSTATVSGVTDETLKIRIKLNGVTHPFAGDMDLFLVGPRGEVCALMSDAGEGGNISSVDLVIADDAASLLPASGAFAGGTYRPTDHATGEAAPPGSSGGIGTSLAALLLPAPATVPFAPEVGEPTTPTWPNGVNQPLVVNRTADVGARILAPNGEIGAPDQTEADRLDYLAGHIVQKAGNSFHPTAYKDPLADGFEEANRGAIIPVNAIPGANKLEVLWFRESKRADDFERGFKSIHWPSVVGYYTLQWPAGAREIVLASNDGSGGLGSLEAKGSIYTQNNSSLPGYNPNEEHALMLGGQAFALRDDLNLTEATVPATLGGTYSSAPFVLLEYTDSDGRTSVTPFKVLREKPEAGQIFDYLTKAGSLLQAPMPLPFLTAPLDPQTGKNLNGEVDPGAGLGDLPVGWDDSLKSGEFGHYARFTFEDRKHNKYVYRGLHNPPAPADLASGTYDGEGGFTAPPSATAVVGKAFAYHIHTSRAAESLNWKLGEGDSLPAGLALSSSHVAITGTPAAGAESESFSVVITAPDDTNTVSLTISVAASGEVETQAPMAIEAGGKTYVGRPPELATAATPANSFQMQFYYQTLAGFAWPGHPDPAPGTIAPYVNSADDGTLGSAISTPEPIVYRPIWPGLDTALDFGETLMESKRELPAVRGQTSVQLLYQQSIALGDVTTPQPSVILHDPTREKTAVLGDHELDKLPRSIKTDLYQGRFYFPNLPAHLATRLFYDPARSVTNHGELVLKGEFKDKLGGEKYVQLNVLNGNDLMAVYDLVPDTDSANRSKWVNLVDALAADVERFVENPETPGTYIVGSSRSVDLGEVVEVKHADEAVDSYALSAAGPGQGYVVFIAGNGEAFTPEEEPVSIKILRVSGGLYRGEIKVLASPNPLSEQTTFQHTADLGGSFADYDYQWKKAPSVDGGKPVNVPGDYPDAMFDGVDHPLHTFGGSGIEALVDNYVIMRYRPNKTAHPLYVAKVDGDWPEEGWSKWTEPVLAEGWIKRVLAGINPFNQRVTDLFNNEVNTDVSLITQAGHRWEGDIALNLENVNNAGLIEIYETVLNRGKDLSIESGINFGPANDALLLAAGYINDLYMLLGNEAWADASNPTIGIGTKDQTYGDIATALFSFRGQVPTLLEEELALLRGRDDFLQPGVMTAPVYNRLVWNYTRGIDAGEVVYALNYNIQESPNTTADGIVNAADAAYHFPQGHGDAYGHYLSALKGYCRLILNEKFDWVPRIEAVKVLGLDVNVDYLDERKFASASAAVARAGRQTFDLTWRKDHQPGDNVGWESLEQTRVNNDVTYTNLSNVRIASTNYWGMDHWATRTGQGAFLNWVVGNAILPSEDPDPDHQGIQKVDRATVPELRELVATYDGLQTDMDSAEGRLSPLGLPENAIAFDIDPNKVAGADGETHFEQVYQRATAALKNAVVSFDDAKGVTALMRSEQDTLVEFQYEVARQETAYTNALIEIYGAPYTDDIGVGRLYKTGYAGPDLMHYTYVETPEMDFNGVLNVKQSKTWRLDIQQFPADWQKKLYTSFAFVTDASSSAYREDLDYVEFTQGPHGFYDKPATFRGKRRHPGQIQQAISDYIRSYYQLRNTLGDSESAKLELDKAINLLAARQTDYDEATAVDEERLKWTDTLQKVQFASDVIREGLVQAKEIAEDTRSAIQEGLPKNFVAGLAAGGDLTSIGRSAIGLAKVGFKIGVNIKDFAAYFQSRQLEFQAAQDELYINHDEVEPRIFDAESRQIVVELSGRLSALQGHLSVINQRLRDLDDAQRSLDSLIAEGDRIQAEREVFRKRAAAVIQGYRTRDAGFRIFRNEKLERYKALFDLTARYSLVAANAYDYETGLLGTDKGRSFVSRIAGARALGVVADGEPQYAGSNTGDPGLSSVLAEMKADWDVLRGRLGFNNPDAYGTTFSLRTENARILPGEEGDANWRDVLERGRMANILDDPDVRRYCLQIDPGNGLPVPGLVVDFSTVVARGLNLFGNTLAGGDHAYSSSAYATKIFAAGLAFEGYQGMDDPVANGSAAGGSGSSSPPDPNLSFLDPTILAATPHVYLIPVGVDSMRSPPLGDASEVRTWLVNDATIPLPFNIGGSDFSASQLYQSADSLSEPLFSIRKHQAFRPVSSATAFTQQQVYDVGGGLASNPYTNRRLIGRSVWNSGWKIVIPGDTLLNNPDEGLDRFLRTVKDIRIHFVTYSYAGN